MHKIKTENLLWIDIKGPSEQDVKYLKEKFNLHDLILNELVPASQRSKVELFDNQLYLVLYFPVFDKKTRQTKPRELDIIIDREKNIIVTSHYKTILPLKAVFDQCNLYEEAKAKYLNQGPAMLLYYIIESILSACLPKLDHIAEKIERIEDRIFQGHEKEMVSEISIIQRDILNMSKAIKPAKTIIQSLETIAPRFFGQQLRLYFQDLSGSYAQVRSVLDSNQEMIESLHQTNESLLSNKISEIMKTLTIISFITFPLGVIAGIFGMNVFDKVGFAHHQITFWIIILAMLSLAGTMFVVFRKKKWL
ncbi:MAG: magnesium transporter CorA family protein [bacterium]